MSLVTGLDHVFVVLICSVFLYAILKTQPKLAGQSFTTKEKLGMYRGQTIFLYLIGGLATVVWCIGGRSLADLGFRWPEIDSPALFWGITLLYGAIYLLDVGSLFLSPARLEESRKQWQHNTPFMPARRNEILEGVHMGFAAGVGEEIVFRGFFINYFVVLLAGQSLWNFSDPITHWQVIIATLVPAAIFALSHRYVGWKTVFKIFFLAVVLSAMFVLSKSLLYIIVLHFLIDLVACLIGPTMLAEADSFELEGS